MKDLTEKVIDDAKTIFSFLSMEDKIGDLSKGEMIAVSGNWYDKGKVPAIASLALAYPESPIFIAGGIGRFSSQHSIEFGGEAIEMLEHLNSFGIQKQRLKIYTGGRQTGDNVRAILFQRDICGSKKVIALEESYLIRRVRATFLGNGMPFSDLRMFNPGSKSFNDLVILHKNNPKIAIFHMLGEITRLKDYSNSSNEPYLFSQNQAYSEADKFGGITYLDSIASNLKNSIRFKEIKAIEKNNPAKARESLIPVYS